MDGFKVYAVAATPNGPFKNGPGEVNVPIEFAGKRVCPGDIVVADGDGALFIRKEDAPAILEAVRKVETTEAEILRRMNENGSYDRPWVKEKLREIGTEIR